jgi:hypothetical protein
MGMFDWVRCNKEMPDGFVCKDNEADWYQTKDFSCNLSVFEITDEGELILRTDHSNGQEKGHINFTGEIEIFAEDHRSKDLPGLLYIATFVDSQLTSLRKVLR